VKDLPTGPLPLALPAWPWLQDHAVEGRPVLAAVHALELLARAAAPWLPPQGTWTSQAARFLRFLELPATGAPPEAWVALSRPPEGGLRATLQTRAPAGRSGLLRSRSHVELHFGGPAQTAPPSPAPAPDRPGFSLPADRLYAELVPFGPGFQTLVGPQLLYDGSARGEAEAPQRAAEGPPLLGSPYPLDAAFHLACAWGQRRLGRVLFPTGYRQRQILRPVEPGERVRCEVRPQAGASSRRADFDLWLHAAATGELLEWAEGVAMEDLFGGRRRVPGWLLPALAR